MQFFHEELTLSTFNGGLQNMNGIYINIIILFSLYDIAVPYKWDAVGRIPIDGWDNVQAIIFGVLYFSITQFISL